MIESVLQRFYSFFEESIFMFGITTLGGNVTQSNENRLDRVISRYLKVVGQKQDNLETTHDSRSLQ